MLSPRIISNDGNSGEPFFKLNNYGPWSPFTSYARPFYNVLPLSPALPYAPQPVQMSPMLYPIMTQTSPSSFLPVTAPVGLCQERSRSITPEIIIKRRRCHHRSFDPHKRIKIPLDQQTITNLGQCPRPTLEIEHVQCHRRRNRHKSCYEVNSNDNSLLAQPQSKFLITNPCLSPTIQPSFTTSANTIPVISEFSPDIIQNLPKQTVYLPPIKLPAATSSNNVNSSVIQSNSLANAKDIQPVVVPIPAQAELRNSSTYVQHSTAAPAMLSGPFMQQIQDLVQQLKISSPATHSSSLNNNILQPPPSTVTSNYNGTTQLLHNQQAIPQINTNIQESYSSATTQPTHITNHTSNYPTTLSPTTSYNNAIYPSTTPMLAPNQIHTVPSNRSDSTTYPIINTATYPTVNSTSLPSQNNIPYSLPNTMSRQVPNSITTSALLNYMPYPPANITPATEKLNNSFELENTTPHSATDPRSSNSFDPKTYAQTNIPSSNSLSTANHQSPFITNKVPPNLMNTKPYQSTHIMNHQQTPDVNFYPPANIKSFNPVFNDRNESSILRTSIASEQHVPKLSSSTMLCTFNNKMPKPILRHTAPNNLSRSTLTRINLPSFTSTNGTIPKLATLV